MIWPSHGSNPQYLYEAMDKQMPEERIDFSANINPLGPPRELKDRWGSLFQYISDYPDPRSSLLKSKLAAEEGIEETQILVGNGGAELITLIGRMIAGKNALIIQPAFSEYEEACRVNHCTVSYHQLEPGDWNLDMETLSEKLNAADAAFFCNPNNPTGVYYPSAMVKKLMEECQRHGCLLIMDEAFYDFASEYQSIVPYIGKDSNVVVLRSMTKMFSIPGLRLGYMMAGERLIEKAAALKPHWSVNALALKAGEWCLDSKEHVRLTKDLIRQERARLVRFYQQLDFNVSPSSVNFYLLRDPRLDEQLPLFRFLLEKGIIPRHTMNFPGLEGRWLRFAIKGPKDNDVLMEAMEEWRKVR
ncbi:MULTISPECIES: threonine-phosphate decarboxylase CobD [unclassified Cytobacillus]|uniref:threonine-phosphate decarboxylase CobD n=1 Tax=unclassified Cytobacillus TaxID=2675268 RepID=UPI00203B617E|nr:threonine-phosphate decarboxylase CobD [Cytobacillus sp. AMY 15.2]MCM3092878.1 threonine-phosphate decarboxylase CobD [Cytobacillus sp. AMY 15.2]